MSLFILLSFIEGGVFFLKTSLYLINPCQLWFLSYCLPQKGLVVAATRDIATAYYCRILWRLASWIMMAANQPPDAGGIILKKDDIDD